MRDCYDDRVTVHTRTFIYWGVLSMNMVEAWRNWVSVMWS